MPRRAQKPKPVVVAPALPRPRSTAPLSSASTSSLSSLTSFSSSSSDDEPLASRSLHKRKRQQDALLPPKQPTPPLTVKKNAKNAKKPRVASREGSKAPVGDFLRVRSKKRRGDEEDGEWGPHTRRSSSSAAEPLPSVYRKRSREPSTTARVSEDRDEFVRPERVIHTDEEGYVADKLRSSKTAVYGLTKIGRYKPGMCSLFSKLLALTWRLGFRGQNIDDKAFELPDDGFPVISLEFPNAGSFDE